MEDKINTIFMPILQVTNNEKNDMVRHRLLSIYGITTLTFMKELTSEQMNKYPEQFLTANKKNYCLVAVQLNNSRFMVGIINKEHFNLYKLFPGNQLDKPYINMEGYNQFGI